MKLFLSNLEGKLGSFGKQNLMRSGMVTGILVGLLVVGASVAYFESGKGHLHKLEEHLSTPEEQEASPPRPGGQDPVVLSRSPVPGGLFPEFLSATLLPGRGMDVLQISAYLPEKGEVNLLAATDVAGAVHAMTGVDEDYAGAANLTDGGTFLLPWAGRLAGLTSMDGKSATVNLRNQVFSLPANTVESAVPVAYGGMLLNVPSNNAGVNTMPDGGSVTATYATDNFGGRWPSKTETKVSALLSSRWIELTVDVKNVGDSVVPVGIGWSPRFLIPSGDRKKATLRIPADVRSDIRDSTSGMPNGELKPVTGTKYDFNTRNGAELGTLDLNDTFLHLKAPLDMHPMIELRDPAARFGLRITALTPTIKAVHVFSPANSDYVSISPQMNYDDPFGRWPAHEDTGMAEVAPGQSVEWKIRLELFPIAAASSPKI
ncbi:hypothetical protein [Granulicella sibirica]|uniref:Uncharacterized protein n=1 Tax=Granulicella sibirica TaxID=2479048 RepID=A0A4Q0SXE2_9BACT|nr:hypothetical protein [Granulicella sibirica]RXH55507.1 hypothetical protein GRAN_2364 [Granulicella sibirica]